LKDPYVPNTAEIVNVKKQSHDTKTYSIRLVKKEKREEFRAKPGQFVMVSLPGLGEAPFSLSSGPEKEDSFDSTIRAVGNVTTALDQFGIGAKIGVRGPYGKAWPIEEAKARNILLVAGGIGLAPLRPVIKTIQANRGTFKHFEILYGTRTPADEIFTDEYDQWQRIPNTTMHLTVDSVPKGVLWPHRIGVVTALFDDTKTTPEDSIVMTCGPEIMMRFAAQGLVARKFRKDQIYLSLERRMKCGMGHCGHCQIGRMFVCRDGPVFNYLDLEGLPDLTL